MGIISKQVEEAFESLKKGDLRKFCDGLTNFSATSLRWHNGLIGSEIEINLKKLAKEEEYCKDIIGTFKKLELLKEMS